MKTPEQACAPRHHRDSPRWSRNKIMALAAAFALVGGGFAACGGDLKEDADNGSSQGAGGENTSFGTPSENLCEGHGGETICDGNTTLSCSAEGAVLNRENCLANVCVAGQGCKVCEAGEFSCQGNTVASCDVSTDPPTWTLGESCDLAADKLCSPAKGACVAIESTGRSAATGNYYQFAQFRGDSSEFLGGYDVDSYENTIYVHRGSNVDAYSLELLDSDGDGNLEPNQHPDNPDATGPIEERKLTLLKTYDVPQLGGIGSAELYATGDKIFFLGTDQADIFELDLASGDVITAADAKDSSIKISHLGYNDVLDVWYGSNESSRRVYAFHEPTNSWALQFQYPDMAGSHMDGIEVVTDQKTGTPYIYVSDMTSDYLGQYRYDRKLGWVQENVFEYSGTGEPVEGLGFGALNHFWATGDAVDRTNGWEASPTLYEIGGGDLSQYIEPQSTDPK